VRSLKEDRDEVATAMAHTTVTQEQQYLQKTAWEKTENFVGRRVELPGTSEGRNEGKMLRGVIALNDGSNPDYPPQRRPYMVRFDKQYKEEPEMVSFPEPDIKFLDGTAPEGASSPPPPPPAPAARKPRKPTKKRRPKKSK
jgi:hypothetical protein